MRTAIVGFLLVTLPACALAAAPDASERLRSYLEGLDAGDVPAIAGETLNEPDLLARFYRSRNSTPVWLDGGPLKKQT